MGPRARPPNRKRGIAISVSPLYRDYFLLGLLACIWASGFTFIKVAVETVPPFTLAAGRIVVAGIFLFAYARLMGEKIPWSARL